MAILLHLVSSNGNATFFLPIAVKNIVETFPRPEEIRKKNESRKKQLNFSIR